MKYNERLNVNMFKNGGWREYNEKLVKRRRDTDRHWIFRGYEKRAGELNKWKGGAIQI